MYNYNSANLSQFKTLYGEPHLHQAIFSSIGITLRKSMKSVYIGLSCKTKHETYMICEGAVHHQYVALEVPEDELVD